MTLLLNDITALAVSNRHTASKAVTMRLALGGEMSYLPTDGTEGSSLGSLFLAFWENERASMQE